MRTLNAKAFWTYSLFAGIAAFLSYLLCAWIWLDPSDRYPNAEYQAYRTETARYQAWERENGKKADARLFEDVISGRKPADSMGRSDLQEVAASVHALGRGAAADPASWSKALTELFVSTDGDPRANMWLSCTQETSSSPLRSCRFVGELEILNDPARLASVLRGDESAFTAVPPRPDKPAYSGPKLAERPAWFDWARWILFSSLFGVFFCITGLIARGLAVGDSDHYGGTINRPEERGWGHPFRAWPNFVLGWLVMLATAPGFVITRILYLLAIDVTPAVNAWLKPAWRKVASLFVSKPTYADEYEEFSAKLSALRAQYAGDKNLVAEIDRLHAAVTATQDGKRLKTAKDILENIRVRVDLDRELGLGA